MLLSILLQAGGAQRITQAMQEGVSTLSTIGRIAYNGVMTIAFLVSLVSLVMLLTGERGEEKTKKAGAMFFSFLAFGVLLLIASRLFNIEYSF